MKNIFLMIVLCLFITTPAFAIGYSSGTGTSGSSGDSWSDAVDSDIVPGTNNTYDMGSPALSFKDLYMSGDIYADGSALYFDNANDELTVTGGFILGSGVDQNENMLTVDRSSTDVAITWDEANDEIDINFPINIAGTNSILTFENGVELDNDTINYFYMSGMVWTQIESDIVLQDGVGVGQSHDVFAGNVSGPKTIQLTIADPDQLAEANYLVVWSNESSDTFTISSIKAWSDDAMGSMSLGVMDNDGASETQLCDFSAITAGTNCYYGETSSMSSSAITTTQVIYYDYVTGTPDYIKLTIIGSY